MRPSPFTASGCSRRAAARYHGRCRGFVWGSTMTARAVTALPAVLLAALLVALLPAPPARGTGAAADFDLAKLNEGGYVVLLRHVTAGGSDADDFDLADCRTQRQVGASGRAQAAELAARFKSAGVAEARVLSSQWCRAKQTAELLGLGTVVEEPALNYYHWKLGSEAAMNETLRGYLSALRAPLPGRPLALFGARQSVVSGTSVFVRVVHGGRRST